MIVPVCDNCVTHVGPLEQLLVGFVTPRRCVGCGTTHHVHAYNDRNLLTSIERARAQLQSLAAAASIYVEETETHERRQR
jgi:hypothetical protein